VLDRPCSAIQASNLMSTIGTFRTCRDSRGDEFEMEILRASSASEFSHGQDPWQTTQAGRQFRMDWRDNGVRLSLH
jgi:hypothetical protein